jgi:hypothetical protein
MLARRGLLVWQAAEKLDFRSCFERARLRAAPRGPQNHLRLQPLRGIADAEKSFSAACEKKVEADRGAHRDERHNPPLGWRS